LGQSLVHLLVLVESNPDVDPVHRLPEEERPEGHREVGRHPHHLLPLLRSLWLAASSSPALRGGLGNFGDGCGVFWDSFWAEWSDLGWPFFPYWA